MQIYPVKSGAGHCNFLHVQRQPTFCYLLVTARLVSLNCAELEEAILREGVSLETLM